MKFVIVGLGNPGNEYEQTRHNTGRLAVVAFGTAHTFGEFVEDRKNKSLLSNGRVGTHSVTLVLPETFMNKSGRAVGGFITSAKAAKQLVVAYDDIDLPFGAIKLSFGRGSGGHKGLESIIRAVKTKDFVRVRIGIAPTTPGGKLKKPQGAQKVHDFILGEFTTKEKETLTQLFKTTTKAIESIIVNGHAKAMNEYN